MAISTLMMPTAVASEQDGNPINLMTLEKSAFEQRGVASGSPTKPGGKLTRISLGAWSGKTPCASSLLLKSKLVVNANGCEPACTAGEPSWLVKVTSKSLRPKLARADADDIAATTASNRQVAASLTTASLLLIVPRLSLSSSYRWPAVSLRQPSARAWRSPWRRSVCVPASHTWRAAAWTWCDRPSAPWRASACA